MAGRTRRRSVLTVAILVMIVIAGLVWFGPLKGVMARRDERAVGSPPGGAAAFTGRFPDGGSSRIFASTSFWYRPLPDQTPQDSRSAEIVAHISRVARESFREDPYDHPPTLPNDPPAVIINTRAYSPGVFIARQSDPLGTFTWDNCGYLESHIGDQLATRYLSGVRVPPGAHPAEGNDREMVIYNRDTRQLTELWHVTRLGPTHFSACWGGNLPDASRSNGVFPGHFGATATGLSFVGGMITASELEAGRIDHVLGLVVDVSVLNGRVSSPAQRTDGRAQGTNTIAAGQMLRLPASLDLDAMNLSPASRTIAKAVQRYGLIVWDGGAPFTFRAVNPNSLDGLDPYPALIGDEGYGLMGNTERGEEPFPIDKLQVLPRNYQG